MRDSDVESGTVTVTCPRVQVTDGFTSDGVIDIWGSSVSSIESMRMPISSTSDEGLGGKGTYDIYIDDLVWASSGEDDENGWNADGEQSTSQGISSNGESVNSTEGLSRGREPSIVGLVEMNVITAEGESHCHGCEPSIAGSGK